MKKSRFRWRITLWFSLALLLMCLVMGGAVISLYRVKIENDVLDQLQLTVDQCAETIEKEPELQAVLRGSEAKEIESSVFLQDSVFLTIYHEDQTGPADYSFTERIRRYRCMTARSEGLRQRGADAVCMIVI